MFNGSLDFFVKLPIQIFCSFFFPVGQSVFFLSVYTCSLSILDINSLWILCVSDMFPCSVHLIFIV